MPSKAGGDISEGGLNPQFSFSTKLDYSAYLNVTGC